MSTPVRKEIEKIIARCPDPGEARLRDAVEWFKMARNQNYLMDGGMSPLELEAVDNAWATLVGVLANNQGVPGGFMAYFLAALAQQESALVGTAVEEAKEAIAEVEAPEEASEKEEEDVGEEESEEG